MPSSLECLDCHKRIPPTVYRLRCESCGGLFRFAFSGSERSSDQLPRSVSLGEGNTPVIELKRTAGRLGLEKLIAKLEFMSLSGSFKDRGSAVLISAALAEGVKEFVEDSSGNAGASLAAYAAAAGIKAHIFVPSSAASGKLDQIRIFGAELHAVDGPRQAATDAAERFVAGHGLPHLSHGLSPYFIEGIRPFSYELADRGQAPVHIVLPVGNGALLIGAKAGFDELSARTGMPVTRFHAVQVEAVQPVAAAVNGTRWQAAQAWPTAASGIAVSSPPRLAQCIDAVKSSGGAAVTVTDAAALEWQRRLAADEGIFCEVTSAVAFAGLEKLIADGAISTDEPVLIPITGSGLKEPVGLPSP